MEIDMTAMIHVYFRLSHEGQRAALAAGAFAGTLQCLPVEPTPEWLALPGLFVDDDGQARIGIGIHTPREKGDTYGFRVPGPWIVETNSVEREARSFGTYAVKARPGEYRKHEFDQPMTANELLRWEQERLAQVERSRLEALARVDEDRAGYEQALAEAKRWRWEKFRPHMISMLEEDGRFLDEQTREKLQLYIETGEIRGGWGPEHLLDIARRERNRAYDEEAKRRYALDRREWIAVHGSDHLQRLDREGIELDKVYRDERLELEAPGFIWARILPKHDLRDALNPRPEHIELLDEARKTKAHNVTLRYLRFGSGTKSGGGLREGIVAAGSFLGESVIYRRS